MNGIVVLVLLVLNIPVYKFLFKFFFDDIDEFYECLRYLFTPDIISLFRREYWKDHRHEFKLGIYIFCCASIVGFEYLIISGIFLD